MNSYRFRQFGLIFCCVVLFFCEYRIARSEQDKQSDGTQITQSSNNVKIGRWREFRAQSSEEEIEQLTDEQKKMIQKLESIGYLSGSRPATEKKNVTRYNKDLAFPGYNFCISGHAPEAFLMDMEGTILHRWRFDFDKAFGKPVSDTDQTYWRRAFLLPTGGLMAIYEGWGLIQIDRDSNLDWAYPGQCHHDLDVSPEGLIYVLSREGRILKRFSPTRPTLEDFITILDSDGNQQKRVSIIQCFENSFYAPLLISLRKINEKYGDILHTNTIQYLDGCHTGRSEIFQKGNLLISIRNINILAIIDPEKEETVWAMDSMWRQQHEPVLLENGNMLVFDNLGYDLDRARHSTVLEFDPLSQKVAWYYRGDPLDSFFTESCGTCQRLPNGNTLITESDNGRAFEVTPDKEIVWEFYNPHRVGEDEKWVATLFDVQRVVPASANRWLSPPEEKP